MRWKYIGIYTPAVWPYANFDTLRQASGGFLSLYGGENLRANVPIDRD